MEPSTLGAVSNLASGLLSTSSSPAMASGYAYGSPTDVSVGGLTVNKTQYPELIAAAVVGFVVAWLVKR
jgi:hypothetical protein